ncbi:hypothetical protein ALP75_205489 [Pseudomonas syringae pv. actinidiae]|nr:hypothetical protein ALP75_205489 [Pseudomonas syringae pv. actinidiae]
MPITRPVRCCAAMKISLPILNRMPASKAAASEAGKRRTMRSKLPVTPQRMTRIALVINAPIACGYVTPPRLVINSAAPGVDHATVIGVR